MKYIYNLNFRNEAECIYCMLCRGKGLDGNGESITGCAALGNMPKCPDEGRRNDCPLIGVPAPIQTS